jgi:hypothetical protein
MEEHRSLCSERLLDVLAWFLIIFTEENPHSDFIYFVIKIFVNIARSTVNLNFFLAVFYFITVLHDFP